MTHALVTAENLNDALDDIVDRVPGAKFAVVLSPDGIMLGASRGIDEEIAEQLSSVVCGLQALGLAAARLCGEGELHQVVVQMSRAFLFHATTGNGAILTVGIDGSAEVGDMAYEVALFCARAGHHLPVYVEPAPHLTGR
ncbi:roadblock/LC7 domain-containing protein [Micromonospora sp. NPDC049903]|uniref:roadblock/LC7 domain-containing protein n=1 Tax=Micromonospora sp. NPDC049903 TaxID=3364276 RepID=UPI00379957BA